MAKNIEPVIGSRKALLIGCGVKSFAGWSNCGNESVHVAPLSAETAILNGIHGETPRPPPKNLMLLPSFQSNPDCSLNPLKSKNNSGGSHSSAPKRSRACTKQVASPLSLAPVEFFALK